MRDQKLNMSPYGESATSPWPIVVIRRLIGRAVRGRAAPGRSSRDTGQASQGASSGPAEAQHQQRTVRRQQPTRTRRPGSKPETSDGPPHRSGWALVFDPMTLQLTAAASSAWRSSASAPAHAPRPDGPGRPRAWARARRRGSERGSRRPLPSVWDVAQQQKRPGRPHLSSA